MSEQPATSTKAGELPKIESLADRTKRFLSEVVADWIKLPIAEVGRWIKGRVTPYVIGLVLVSAGAVFLLVGGIQGLQSIPRMPPWVPYLGMGAVATGLGALMLRR